MEQRRQSRVPFSSHARLLTRGGTNPLPAHVRNLSASGLFLTSDVLPNPGTEVRCRFRLANTPREFLGRVAWVEPVAAGGQAHPRGAGIEFVDLSQQDRHLLQQVTQQLKPGPEPDEPAALQPLSVWFEGLTTAVRTQGQVSEDEIVVTTQLPFLRVGSDVKVGLEDGGHRYARIDGLALESLQPGEPPRIVVRLRAMGEVRARAKEAGDMSSALRPGAGTVAAAAERARQARAGALTPPPQLLAVPTPPPLPARKIPTPPPQPAPGPPPLPSLALLPPAAEAPPAAPSQSPAGFLRPGSWKAVRLPLVALLLGAGLWAVGTRVARWQTSRGASAGSEPQIEVVETLVPKPVPEPPVVAQLPPVERAAQPAAVEPEVAAPGPAPGSLPPLPRMARAPFRFRVHPGHLELVVPVLGPSAPSEVLSLAPQAGVVAILPRARAPRHTGLFVVRHPVIDRVAVEDRPLGLYVRVLLGPSGIKARVEHAVGELRVIVEHDGSLRSK